MSLSAGDFAVALTEKDSERLTLRNELNKLEDLQAAGTDRLLRLTATGLRKEGLTSSRVVYSYSIDHTNVKHNGKAEGEVVDFQLLSEKDVIDIIAEAATFNEDGERTTLTYIAQFPVAKIPLSATTDEAVVAIVADAPEETPATEATNGEEATTETTPVEAPVEKTAEVTPVIGEWVKLSLSAVDGDDADSTATIDVTAKHIAIQEAIVEKTAQMEKAVEEIAELQRRYKATQEAIVNEQKAAAKASTTTTTTKKKATAAAGKRKSTGKVTKKTTKSSQSSADEEDAEAAEEPTKQVAKKGYGLPSLGEIQTYALNAGITALNVALTQRAVLFFAAAAIGVYTVGDYASV